jgi:hypothetical protein
MLLPATAPVADWKLRGEDSALDELPESLPEAEAMGGGAVCLAAWIIAWNCSDKLPEPPKPPLLLLFLPADVLQAGEWLQLQPGHPSHATPKCYNALMHHKLGIAALGI